MVRKTCLLDGMVAAKKPARSDTCEGVSELADLEDCFKGWGLFERRIDGIGELPSIVRGCVMTQRNLFKRSNDGPRNGTQHKSIAVWDLLGQAQH